MRAALGRRGIDVDEVDRRAVGDAGRGVGRQAGGVERPAKRKKTARVEAAAVEPGGEGVGVLGDQRIGPRVVGEVGVPVRRRRRSLGNGSA